MKILMSNDDGVFAEGINVLREALQTIGDVTVVAPDRNRSGASNSLTLDNPVRLQLISEKVTSVQGTPTDCVHLALTGYLDEKPDIVVSGINHGPNMGDDVLYSGTVAAAMEGRFLGYPAIALSNMAEPTAVHMVSSARIAADLLRRLIEKPLPSNTILNVNIPDLPYEEIRGFEVTRLGTRHLAQPMVKGEDPRGRLMYWVGCAGSEQDAGAGTDFNAVKRGYVSITPLHVDLTHYEGINGIAEWIENTSVHQVQIA